MAGKENNKVFQMDVAIDEAYDEFSKLVPEDRNQLNIMLVARKYAPRTHKQVLDCLIENPALMFMEAKGGHLVIDVLIADIAEAIAAVMIQRYAEQAQKEEMEQARRASLRRNLSVVP